MSAVRCRNTEPELILRRELHGRGLRYRVKTKLPGKPDIVFPSARIAVFADGDFWHGHGWVTRGLPNFDSQFNHKNSEFWKHKIEGNMRRDEIVDEQLKRLGWTVARFWESDIRKDVGHVADAITDMVRGCGNGQ